MRALLSGLRDLLRRTRRDADLDAELRAFYEASVEAKLAAGMPREQAERAARLELGSTAAVKEGVLDVAWETRLETVWHDVRYATRLLGRRPAFAIAAALTLALGIGAATAIFSVVNGVLLKPLPYRDADRLVIIRAEQDYEGAARPVRTTFPSAAAAAWPRMASLEAIGFYARGVAALAGPAGSELVDTATVSGAFFDTIGGDVAVGRMLTPADDMRPAAVISERFWTRRYARSDAVIGQPITLNGQTATIVGVAAATFQIPEPETDVWLPAGFVRLRNPACCGFTPVARLAPGVNLSAARDEIAAVGQSLAAEMPRALGGIRVETLRLRDAIVDDVRLPLLVLTIGVLLLLLLACANVSNMSLARQMTQRHEMALRRALGASDGRLAGQALAGSAVLCAAGAAAGVALAIMCVRALQAFPPAGLPRLETVAIDGAALLFAVVAAVASTLTVSLLPIRHARDINVSLKSEGAGTTTSRSGRASLRVLTVAQVALSLILLVGALLLGRSLVALLHTDLGVTPDRVVTASLNLAMDRRLTDAQQVELVAQVVQRIATLPGVTSAGVGAARPPDASRMRLTLNRSEDPDARATFQAAAVPATPGYFSALGIRLERGRLFTDADVATAAPVVILSAGTARQLFGDVDPLGRTIGLPVLRDGATAHEAITVVGITSEVKYSGMDREPDAVVYRPFAQQPWRSVFLVARTAADPGALARQLRAEIAAVDPGITVGEVATLDEILADATAQPRFRTLTLVALALAAVAIAGVGLYGVIGCSVARRTREIGVRIALGANRRRIQMMVLREGLALAALGCAVGLTAAGVMARLLGSLLFGIAPTDLASFALAAAGVLAAATLASGIPAARASRTDPLTVLKSE